MSAALDITGQRYGRLTVLTPAPKRGKQTAWTCVCDCGTTTHTTTASLRSGSTRSCGCLQREVAAAKVAAVRPLGHRVAVPTYDGLHLRLRRERGPASNQPCLMCGRQAHDWALMTEGDVVQVKQRTHRSKQETFRYSVDLDNYSPLCRSCHWLLDRTRKGQPGPVVVWAR